MTRNYKSEVVKVKLSTKGRYGLKAMFELALNEASETPMPLKYIAEKHGLSEQYLEQIFAILKKSNLVKSVRGAQGGYLLSKSSSLITVGSVLRALEGPMAPADCVIESDSDCENSEFCVTQVVWRKIKYSIDSVIDSVTLEDMVNDHNLKGGQIDIEEM